jgi:hypothetical protein
MVGDAVGEALGVDTEARRIRMLAVPVVICGLGEALGEAEGDVLWFKTMVAVLVVAPVTDEVGVFE